MNEVKKPKKPLIYYYGIVLVALLLFNFLAVPWLSQRQVKEVDYGTFMTMTEEKQVGKVEVQDNQILFTDKDEKQVYKTGLMTDPDLVNRLKASGAEFSSEIQEQMSPVLSFLLSWLVPILFFVGIGQLMSKRMMSKFNGPNSMMFGGKNSSAKVYVKSADGIKFSDVAGEDEAKENLAEIVDYLHDPSKYKHIGAHMPKGVLLVGPPGTGKTMLAKAVAGESNVPFFSMSGSEFVEMFVGMGASKVRDLFSQAKEKAPCIVFIDEIDAIGKKRDGQLGGNDEREQTLNQLLTEMDGFEDNTGVIILAATNRPESLDPALTRPGRFDRRVPVELPDLKGREAILKVHAKKVKLADDVDFQKIARMASGASGAELANIVNEGRPPGCPGRQKVRHPVRPGGEHRGGHRWLPEEERHPHRPGEVDGGLSRDRPRPGGRQAEPLRSGAENHHHPPHLWRIGLHHAGGGREPLPDDQGGDREQDRHTHRWSGSGGGHVRHHFHWRIQ